MNTKKKNAKNRLTNKKMIKLTNIKKEKAFDGKIIVFYNENYDTILLNRLKCNEKEDAITL
ncbi:MAG: hypothetical protein PHC46_04390 [Clostridia bacterium]|nr:hypothetical protein [Clostridia bacterium]